MTRIIYGFCLYFIQCDYLGSLNRIWLQLYWLVFEAVLTFPSRCYAQFLLRFCGFCYVFFAFLLVHV